MLALASNVRGCGNKSVQTTDGNIVVLIVELSLVSTMSNIIVCLCALTAIATVRQRSDGRLNYRFTLVMDTSNIGSRVITMMSLLAEDLLNCELLAGVERGKRGKCVSVFYVTVVDAEIETLLLCCRCVDWFMVRIIW